MGMYDKDQMARAAMGMASFGWKLVRLYGIRAGGGCTCRAGTECGDSTGKHPTVSEWQLKATDNEDEIASWFAGEDDTRFNIGVRLGQTSGIIDIECDSDAAREVLSRLGIDRIDTPTFSAGRGDHRIFQYRPDLPDVGVAKIEKVLEVRIGGGNKASQSVFPPSWHRSGKQYQWHPGKSPWDVPPAEIPEDLLKRILESSKAGGSGVISQSLERVAKMEKVAAGGRHAHLLGIASSICRTFRSFRDEDLKVATGLLWASNLAYCDPPKSYEEVVSIAQSQFAYYRGAREERQRASGTSFERLGLEWDEVNSTWLPGRWTLTAVKSDPIEFKLKIPCPIDPSKMITVRMSPDVIMNAAATARAILAASVHVNVYDPTPSRWQKAWLGHTYEDESGRKIVKRGLFYLLQDNMAEEYLAPESGRTGEWAERLLDYIESVTRKHHSDDDEENAPRKGGEPKWRLVKTRSGEEWQLWFKLSKLWEAPWKGLPATSKPDHSGKRTVQELVEQAAGEPTKTGAYASIGGRWQVWKDCHVNALRQLAYGAQCDDSE